VETEVSWGWSEEVEGELRKRARYVARQYGDLDFDDLLQLARLWAATHPLTIATHLGPGGKGLDQVGGDVFRALQKACLRERRQRGGADCLSLDELLAP
jgi:hypothetical protein